MVLPAQVHDQIVAIARAALPFEACGYVVGDVAGTDRIVVAGVHPIENALRSPVAFALDGQSMIDTEARIVDLDQEIVGVFHSHPTSAPVPSRRDLDDAARYDPVGHYLHVIVSMQGFAPRVRAWTYAGEVANELTITAADRS